MKRLVLLLVVACGRGGSCPPPKNAAQSIGQTTSQPCEVRR